VSNETTKDAAKEETGASVAEAFARGNVLFLGVELACAPGALVARKETETLGRTAIRFIEERVASSGPQLVIDMCCGSGNLACAIAKHVSESLIWASDLTDGCVNVARTNVENLGLGDRVSIVQGDLFGPLQTNESLLGKVDVVVCNPPYISTGKLEKDSADLLDKEPREAFDGGPYGIAIHQRVVKDALAFVKPGGLLLFEIGLGQARQVTLLFGRARSWEAVESVTDPQGEVRVLYSRRKNDET
jgi:release factor glutamine methyltransferase